MRATTSFNKMLTLPALTVVDVDFGELGWVVLSIRHTRTLMRCECGWSTRVVHSRSERRWRHLDAFGVRVALEGEIRRMRCRACNKVVTEDVPWARRAGRHTREFENVVAWWTQRSDRTTVATALRVDWMTVTAIVTRVVAEHLLASRFDKLTRIGIDEISYAKNHQYLTVVVDHSEGNVVWVGEGKNADTLNEFYKLLGEKRCAKLTAVSMDMGKAYPAATRKHTTATICWDPFHVVKLLNKAVTDTVRWSKLTKKGLPLSKTEATNLRWALLKKPSDLTDDQAAVLARHQRKRHAIWRAQQLKEDFRGLYQLDDPDQAAAYLTRWLSRASRSRIPPMVKAATMVRENRSGILAAVELGLSNSRLEGTNSKIRLLNHRGYGHHSAKALTAIIYLCCGGITVRLPWQPEPHEDDHDVTPATRTGSEPTGE